MANQQDDYSELDNPYNDQLIRNSDALDVLLGGINSNTTTQESSNPAQAGGNSAASSGVGGGPAQQVPVASGGAMADVVINSSIQSSNWKPKKIGFYIDGQTGYAEFVDVFISGEIEATIGTIGGWIIGPTYIRDQTGMVGLSSAITGGDDVRFWAGSTDINTAPFRVYESGALFASSGEIGGFEIDDTTISGGSTLVLSSTGTGTITGGTIRTSSGNPRVELKASTNSLDVINSAGEIQTRLSDGIIEFGTVAGLSAGSMYGSGTNQIAIDVGDAGIEVTESSILPWASASMSIGSSAGVGNSFLNGHYHGYIYLYESTSNLADYIRITSPTLSSNWTLTLPPNDGSSGQVLTTNGSGVTTWETASASGANTALSNLSSVAINTSLISDTASTDNLGSSSVPWDNLYIDNIYMTNNAGDIFYNSNIAISLFASDVRLGATYDLFGPASALSADLGSGTYRWNDLYADGINLSGSITMSGSISLSGNIDMNGGDINELDRLSGSSGYIDLNASGSIVISNHVDPSSSGALNLGGSSARWLVVYCVTLNESSDERIKKNMEPIPYGLKDILLLEPVAYDFTEEIFNVGKAKKDHIKSIDLNADQNEFISNRRLGFSAQQVARIIPEVTENAIGNTEIGTASISKTDIVPVLVKAIQELSAEIDKLKLLLNQKETDV